jgi:cysteine desulfuration protein SufE
MTLQEKKDALLADLAVFSDDHARLDYLMELAQERPRLPVEFQRDEFRVVGCVSNLWIVPAWREGRCWFQSDSDALIVRGIGGLLCEFYNGETPAAILAMPPDFLREAGVTAHLSSNRRNGLANAWRVLKTFAERAQKGDFGP